MVTFFFLVLAILIAPTSQQGLNYLCEESECNFDLPINATICDRSSGSCSCTCINAVPELAAGCWESSQCQYPGSKCLSFDGQALDIIDLNDWNYSRKPKGIRQPAPGSCKCSLRFWRDETRKSCIRRIIGARCRTSYQCAVRVPHSYCQQRRCMCSHDYEYDDTNDTCLRMLQVNHTDEVCLGDHCSLINDANTIGLIFCLCVTIFFFWCCSCCCSCCSPSKKDKDKTPEEVYLGKDSY